LQKIPANFANDFRDAVDVARFDATCKVGWQANTRFWENNQNQIYGGISYIEAPITQIWYPSYQYFEPKGTLTGAYNYPPQADSFGALPLPERLRQAREQAARLHPEFNDRAIVPEDKGISIAWHNVPYQRGGWANWSSESAKDADAYERLLAPDRRFHVIGDQVSTLPGWQEGAMMSAQHVVEQIAGIRPKTVPDIKRAPSTRKMVYGAT
jgi:monoamine oxidase